jgi:hypothetical protein
MGRSILQLTKQLVTTVLTTHKGWFEDNEIKVPFYSFFLKKFLANSTAC